MYMCVRVCEETSLHLFYVVHVHFRINFHLSVVIRLINVLNVAAHIYTTHTYRSIHISISNPKGIPARQHRRSHAPLVNRYTLTNAYKYIYSFTNIRTNTYTYAYACMYMYMKLHCAALPSSWVFALRLVTGILSFEPFQIPANVCVCECVCACWSDFKNSCSAHFQFILLDFMISFAGVLT